jgi:hypothetical protein
MRDAALNYHCLAVYRRYLCGETALRYAGPETRQQGTIRFDERFDDGLQPVRRVG